MSSDRTWKYEPEFHSVYPPHEADVTCSDGEYVITVNGHDPEGTVKVAQLVAVALTAAPKMPPLMEHIETLHSVIYDLVEAFATYSTSLDPATAQRVGAALDRARKHIKP